MPLLIFSAIILMCFCWMGISKYPPYHTWYCNIEKFQSEDPVGFNAAMEEFVKGVEGQYFYKNPNLPDTSATASYSSHSSQQHYNVPALNTKYAIVTTQRPELFSSSVYQRPAASGHSNYQSVRKPSP